MGVKKVYSLKMRYSALLGDYLKVLIDLLDFLSLCSIDEEIHIDGSDYKWSSPFVTLPLACIYDHMRSNGYNVHLVNFGGSYMSTTYFPEGMNIGTPELGSRLEYYGGKTYIPIVKLSTNMDDDSVTIREKFQSQIHSLIIKQSGVDASMRSALTYLVDELVNNALQHSRADSLWLAAQYYPNEKYIDIAIADSGTAILGSYKQSGFVKYSDISTHTQAIDNAVNGQSTKEDRLSEGSRGFGIRTSKDMLSKGLKGKFVLMSGNAFLLSSSLKDEIISMDGITEWQGTLALLRIPTDVQGFQYTKYVE
ncbi:ATP-binding protein [Pontibacter brevis]